jgi:hypothetical protein
MAQTSSLAEWFDDDDGPEHLDDIEAPAVLVTPNSVVVHGMNTTVLVLHMAEGFLAIAGLGDELETEDRFSLDDLAALAWQLPQLVMACSDNEQPEEVLNLRTDEGITVERIAPGVLALGFANDGSVRIHMPPGIAWQLAAEIISLLVRQLAQAAVTVDQLNAALDASN